MIKIGHYNVQKLRLEGFLSYINILPNSLQTRGFLPSFI